MIRYIPSGQLSIEEFKTPFQVHLDKENRWVKLASLLPWDSLASIYYQSMSTDKGAPSINARIVIGAMVIKHKLKLDDREVVETLPAAGRHPGEHVLAILFGVKFLYR